VNARAERATRAAAVVAVLLGLLAVVALTSSRDRPSVSGGSDPGAVAEVRDIFLTVGATLYVVAIIVAGWVLWKFRGGGRGTGPHLSIGAFLLFVALAAVLLTWGIPEVNEPEEGEVVFGSTIPELQAPPARQPAPAGGRGRA
jgi:hypothetical protein